MNVLTRAWQLMSSDSVVDSLGWLLLHSVWQFAVIAIATRLVLQMMRNRSAIARYRVLVGAILLTVAAPIATGVWVRRHANPQHGTARLVDVAGSNLSKATSNSEPATRLRSEVESVPLLATNSQSVSSDAVLPVRSDVTRHGSASERFDRRENVTASKPHQWPARLAVWVQPHLSVLVTIWVVGMFVFAVRPLFGWYTVARLRRSGTSAVSKRIQLLFEKTANRLGVSGRTTLLQSALVNVPVVVGYFRPIVLLPISLATELPISQIEAILAHELAHVRRYDYVINIVQTIIETVFFYHPAVWWLSRQIRLEREHCCDDDVVATLNNRHDYGRALLALSERHPSGGILALGASGSPLLDRVRRLCGAEKPQRSWASAFACLLVLCVGIGVAGFGLNTNAEDGDINEEEFDVISINFVDNTSAATKAKHRIDIPFVGYPGVEQQHRSISQQEDKRFVVKDLPKGAHTLMATDAGASNHWKRFFEINLPEKKEIVDVPLSNPELVQKYADRAKAPQIDSLDVRADDWDVRSSILVRMTNNNETPWPIGDLSHGDLQLVGNDYRIFLPAGLFKDPGAIQPGRDHGLAIDWPLLVTHGLWVSRMREPKAEPTLPDDDQHLGFRMILWGKTTKNFQLPHPKIVLDELAAMQKATTHIQFDNWRYALGDPISLNLIVKNPSDRDIRVNWGGDSRSVRPLRFKIVVTRDGKRLPDPHPNPMSRGGKGGTRRLKPGEKYDMGALQLDKYCTLSEPGEYQVSVYHDLGWESWNVHHARGPVGMLENRLPKVKTLAPVATATLVVGEPIVLSANDAKKLLESRQNTWSDEKDGVQFGLLVDGPLKTYQRGETIPLVALARNVSDQPVHVQLYANFHWFAPTLLASNETESKLEKFYVNGVDTTLGYREVLQPGDVLRVPHPGIGLGKRQEKNNQPKLMNDATSGYPYWREPISGDFQLSQTLEFNVAKIQKPEDARDADWTFGTRHKFTTGSLSVKIDGAAGDKGDVEEQASSDTPSTISVVKTWQDLLNEKPIKLKQGTARIGIDSTNAKLGGSVMLYCLTENYDVPSRWTSDQAMGPFRIKVIVPGERRLEFAQVQELRKVADTQNAKLLFRKTIPVRQQGVFFVHVIDAEEKTIAKIRLNADGDEAHPWMAFRDAKRGTSAIDEQFDAVARLRSRGGSVVPSIDGKTPLVFQRDGEPAKFATTDSLPHLRPAREQLRLAAVGDRLLIESPVPITLNYPHERLLVRWWINGEPSKVTQDGMEQKAMDQGGQIIRGKTLLMDLEIDPTNIGAELGDKLEMQVLYCTHGWESVSSVIQHLHMFAAENEQEVLLSNRLEIKNPKVLGDTGVFRIPPEVIQRVRRLAAEEVGKPRSAKDRRPAGLTELDTPKQIKAAVELAIADLERLSEPRPDQLSDPRTRLEYLGEDAFTSLIKALESDNETVVYQVCHCLGRHGKRAVEPLIQVLKNHSSKQVRGGAASGLGQTFDPGAVMPLIDALDDKEETVRIEAARSLGYLRDRRALEPLKKCFDDPNGHISQSAFREIQLPNSQGAVYWPPDLLHIRALTIDATTLKGESFGDQQVDELITHLNSDNGSISSACMFALARLQRQESVPAMIAQQPSSSRAYALASMPTAEALDALIDDLETPPRKLQPGEAVQNRVSFAKSSAMSGLAEAGGRWAAPLLVALLDDQDLLSPSKKDEDLRIQWPASHAAHSQLCNFFGNHGLTGKWRNLHNGETNDVNAELVEFRQWWKQHEEAFLAGREVPNPNLSVVWYIDP